MSDTEPDAAERAALGAALAEPGDPLLLSPGEWALVLRIARMLGHTRTGELADIDQAIAAEKERIAQMAEDLGAHYHGPDYDRTASFADYLRGAKA